MPGIVERRSVSLLLDNPAREVVLTQAQTAGDLDRTGVPVLLPCEDAEEGCYGEAEAEERDGEEDREDEDYVAVLGHYLRCVLVGRDLEDCSKRV